MTCVTRCKSPQVKVPRRYRKELLPVLNRTYNGSRLHFGLNQVSAFLYQVWLVSDIVQKKIEKEMMIQEMIVACPFQRVQMVQMVQNKVCNHKILLEVVKAYHLQEWE